jgi:PcfJ-like protein
MPLNALSRAVEQAPTLAREKAGVPAAAYPVQLLRDATGIYGIGGSETIRVRQDVELPLRPDRLKECSWGAALQMITGGFRYGPFTHTAEERLRRIVHHAMLHSAGLPWPAPHNVAYWSADPGQQRRNRQRYHGLRLASLGVVNKLISEALTVADQDALKQARRFTINNRYDLYRYGATSHRALQLIETFPTLALALCHGRRTKTGGAEEAKQLVESGAPLRRIAGLMGLPWAMRRIKPGAAHIAVDCLWLDQRLICAYLPESLPRQKLWLRTVRYANIIGGIEYAEWVARHVCGMGNVTEQQAGHIVSDGADWRRAVARGDKFVTRRFDPAMSLKTVMGLSHEWHEAVANNLDCQNAAFPAPWFSASKIGDIEILPIQSRAELYREGHAMHHCVASYAGDVLRGVNYVYSIQRDGERIATLALERCLPHPAIDQVRGPCNAPASREVMTIVQRWLRSAPEPVYDLPPLYPDLVEHAFTADVQSQDDDLTF